MTDKHVKDVCKPGTTEACRYLTMGVSGWSCAKLTGLKDILDQRVATNSIRAIGDNCEGKGPNE